MSETVDEIYMRNVKEYGQMIKEGKIVMMSVPVLTENERKNWCTLLVDPYTLGQIEKIRMPSETPSKVVEKLVNAKMKELGLW